MYLGYFIECTCGYGRSPKLVRERTEIYRSYAGLWWRLAANKEGEAIMFLDIFLRVHTAREGEVFRILFVTK